MTRVLLPIKVLENTAIAPGLLDLLGPVDVTVLGYHVLPEQTPPDQARMQYEEQANSALETLCAELSESGGEADHRLVFTHNERQTINRIADELAVEAFVSPGMTGPVERLLVPLSGDVAVDRILSFVRTLIGDREITVTLFLADEDPSEQRLQEAAQTLEEAGINVQTKLVSGTAPFPALIEALPNHDVIVMGEQAPSLRSLVFGDEPNRVAAASTSPVIVVQDPQDDSQDIE